LKLIDTHAHLDHIENVDTALKEASERGVAAVVAVGIDLKANETNLAIQKRTRTPKIYVALGMHPESLEDISDVEINECLKFIRDNVNSACAIGEVGLDYWYKWVRKDDAKKELQRKVFQRQLDIAKEFNLPVVIHSRGSWRDCLNMAKATGIRKAVFHWYSGPLDVLEDILAAGYLISASPALNYSPPLQLAVKRAPIEQVLIETDSPVYFGEPEKGFRATPKEVLRTLSSYAALTGINEEQAAEKFFQNSIEFFGINPGDLS
jgi:TatD DNase family protein